MDAWFDLHSRTCCPNASAMSLLDSSLQPLPNWLTLVFGIFDDLSDSQPFALPLTSNHSLRISASAGIAAVGNHTIRIMAVDGRLPQQASAYVDLTLRILGQGPSIVGAFPVIQVADGEQLLYTLPQGVIQLNQPYGQILYSFSQQTGQVLPSWLTASSDGTLSGRPQLGQDASYNLTVTGTDSDGNSNTTTVQLVVRAPCPSGLYRHFRVQGLPSDLPYGTRFSGIGKFLVCSLVWQSEQGQPFPIFLSMGANTSGSIPYPTDPELESYRRAFVELTLPLTGYNTIYPCNSESDAWQVSCCLCITCHCAQSCNKSGFTCTHSCAEQAIKQPCIYPVTVH